MTTQKKHPPYRVTCSCGETAIITFDEKKGEYVANKQGWTYSPETNCKCSTGHRKERAILVNESYEDD